MTFTIGTFDLFTYAVPGSLYLGLIGYGTVRLDLVDINQVSSYPVLMLLVAFAVGSYLLGHATYEVGFVIDKVVPLGKRKRFDARALFASRTADLADRPALRAHYALLQAAAELHDQDVAKDIVRLRAIGLMLRNSTVPILVAFGISIGELRFGFGGPVPALCGVGLLVVAAGCTWRSRVLRMWADLRTLEICYLIPQLDTVINRHESASEPRTPADPGRDANPAITSTTLLPAGPVADSQTTPTINAT